MEIYRTQSELKADATPLTQSSRASSWKLLTGESYYDITDLQTSLIKNLSLSE